MPQHLRSTLLGILIPTLFFITNAQAQQGKMNEVTYSSSYGNGQTFAYLEYLPSDYSDNGKGYPLLISLHGYGWMPDGQSVSFSNLRKGNNVAKLFYYKKKDFPFIVISPQQPKSVKGRYSGTSSWDVDIVDEVLERVKKLRKVDTNRIYITGTSMGGMGVWKYIKEHGDKIAAAAPMAGAGNEKNSACSSNIKNVAVWGFHNTGDNMVGASNTISMVDAINACSPPTKARKTIFKNGTHNVWDRVYYHTDEADKYYPSTKYSSSHPYGPNSGQPQLFDWFLSHSRDGSAPPPAPAPAPSNKAPLAEAGSDKTITLSTDKITVDGSSSTDSDGSIASYKWTKISGPSSYSIISSTAKKTEIKSLKEGTYTFQLTVKDNKGASDTDDLKVTVKKEEAPTPAPAPTPTPVSSGEKGLKYAYYEGNFDKLPNFSNLKPKATGTIANFDLSPRKSEAYYAFSFDGYIDITSSGTYTFYTASDDGSKLYINGKEVVNNDGRHERIEKSGQVSLSKGRHAIKVTYFDKWGSKDILDVYYAGPGISKKRIPSGVLFTGSTGGNSEPPSPTPTPSTGELTYSYYEGTWYQLPDFSKLSPKAKGTVSNFKLSPRKRDSYFAFKFEGEISIASSGTYTFYLASDDGSQLFIDGKRVVNNDGLHAREEKSGNVQLSKGQHAIRVTFFEKQGQEILDVYYKGPGFSKKRIPDSVLGGSGNARTIATDLRKSSFDNPELSLAPEIAMYPNPATDYLTISNAPAAAYSIISVGGKVMSQGTLIDSQRLDVSSLPNGLYIVKVQQQDVQLTERILIQH